MIFWPPPRAKSRSRRISKAALTPRCRRQLAIGKRSHRLSPGLYRQNFGFALLREAPDVEPHILDPVHNWRNKNEFAETAGTLVTMFREILRKFEAETNENVRAAGPTARIALA